MSRRLYAILVAIVLVAALIAPAGPAGATALPSHQYLALGDSYAAGEGATNHDLLGYVPHFYRWLQGAAHSNVDVLNNLAVGGETSASMLAPGGQLAQALAAIADSDTDVGVATLDIGGNDLLDLLQSGPCSIDPTSPTCQQLAYIALVSFGQNYGAILYLLVPALAADPGHATLLIGTYPNPWSGTGSTMEPIATRFLLGTDATVDCAANQTDPYKVGLNDIISCVAMGLPNVLVVDTYPAFLNKGEALTHVMEGDIHPNNAGHAQMAHVYEMVYSGR